MLLHEAICTFRPLKAQRTQSLTHQVSGLCLEKCWVSRNRLRASESLELCGGVIHSLPLISYICCLEVPMAFFISGGFP